MKKEKPTLFESCLQFGHPKKFCRSNRELCRDCTEPLQEGRVHNCGEVLFLYCKEPHKTEDKKICGKYTIETTIQNKMRLDIFYAYTAKETLGYKRRKRT